MRSVAACKNNVPQSKRFHGELCGLFVDFSESQKRPLNICAVV